MNKKKKRTEKKEITKSAKRLLQTLKNAESVEPMDDKKLIREHVERKFT